MTVYRLALYGPDGDLVRVSEAFPIDDLCGPQVVADRCARAADAGCTYEAGAFVVWADHGVKPPEHITDVLAADAERPFGDTTDGREVNR